MAEVARLTELLGERLSALGTVVFESSLPTQALHGDVSLRNLLRTRHRLVVAVLTAIGVPPEAAEQDAEGIEHHISGATLRAFDAFLTKQG